MRNGLLLSAVLSVLLGAQAGPQAPRPLIRSGVNLVVTDVIVRDEKGQFVSNLGRKDFDVFEDGVRQDLVMFVLTHGGRVFNDSGAPPPSPREGLLLPATRPPGDVVGPDVPRSSSTICTWTSTSRRACGSCCTRSRRS